MNATEIVREAIDKSPKDFNGIKLGALPSPVDKKDYKYDIVSKFYPGLEIPKIFKTSFRNNMPKPFDQGSLGTCVAAASCWGFKAFHEITEGSFPVTGLSTAYLYAKCKGIDGIPEMAGTYPRVAMKVLEKFGVCYEDSFPYTKLKGDVNVAEPPTSLNKEAGLFKVKSYAQVCSPEDTNMEARIDVLREAIINEGPILGAAVITENFVSVKAPDYIVPHPEGRLLGGHAICFCDIDDTKELFTVRNTWGERWGDKGYCYLPYRLLTKTFSYDGIHPVPYIMEAWTALDETIPRSASSITLMIGDNVAVVDGKNIQLDQAPIIVNDRSLLPIRFVASNIGFLVSYRDGEITLAKPDGSLTIEFTINKNEIKINGKANYLDQPPILDEKTNRTLVPIRVVSEASNYTVNWNESAKSITIVKNK